jgi:tRNA G18 (ribose-2'-O)-methylase SpoU
MLFCILSDIRSAYNVGAMLRTADGAGVSKVFLCGCTPTPIDRFGRKRADIAKVALGAEESVVWEYYASVEECITSLKKEGVQIVAVEQSPRSIPYNTFKKTSPVAFVFGEETRGIPKSLLDLCDTILEIPMRGKKESLNVSVACGVVLYSLQKEGGEVSPAPAH